jgi:hypothetical protein
MTKRDFILIATVLRQYRHSEATTTIGSTTAMIACDLADALKAQNPRFDAARFHRFIQEAK